MTGDEKSRSGLKGIFTIRNKKPFLRKVKASTAAYLDELEKAVEEDRQSHGKGSLKKKKRNRS